MIAAGRSTPSFHALLSLVLGGSGGMQDGSVTEFFDGLVEVVEDQQRELHRDLPKLKFTFSCISFAAVYNDHSDFVQVCSLGSWTLRHSPVGQLAATEPKALSTPEVCPIRIQRTRTAPRRWRCGRCRVARKQENAALTCSTDQRESAPRHGVGSAGAAV